MTKTKTKQTRMKKKRKNGKRKNYICKKKNSSRKIEKEEKDVKYN